MPIVHDSNPEETEKFRQMMREPGDWVAVYDPERDGDLAEWADRIKAQYMDGAAIIAEEH